MVPGSCQAGVGSEGTKADDNVIRTERGVLLCEDCRPTIAVSLGY